MNFEELKVGNYIEWSGQVKRISSTWSHDSVHYPEAFSGIAITPIKGDCDKVIKSEELNPIQASEDWLKNLGLKPAEEKENLYYKGEFAVEVFGEIFLVGRRCLTKTKEGNVMVFENLVTMIYIHHIQNLASALCGEELTITK